MGRTCLDILLCLVRLQPARDPCGAPLLPLPKVHRQLASPQALPHIAQVDTSLFSNKSCPRYNADCLRHTFAFLSPDTLPLSLPPFSGA